MKKLELVCDESIIRVQLIQTTAEEDKVERGFIPCCRKSYNLLRI